MKKIIVFAFFFLISILGSVSASANTNTASLEDNSKISTDNQQRNVSNWTEEQVDKKLKQLGLTDQQIGYLSLEAKTEIVSEKNAKKFYLSIGRAIVSMTMELQQK